MSLAVICSIIRYFFANVELSVHVWTWISFHVFCMNRELRLGWSEGLGLLVPKSHIVLPYALKYTNY